ncbi:hypothetical protein ACUN22_37625, partial [Streptomyces anulatus]|uniref:hypothetical protein n=1 Tax=Streptomyces anulatus TaxID=1892 RepID=UPI00403DDFA0
SSELRVESGDLPLVCWPALSDDFLIQPFEADLLVRPVPLDHAFYGGMERILVQGGDALLAIEDALIVRPEPSPTGLDADWLF